jgi:maltose alpha-D-glucosyltransferase/alpha-amylase
VRAPLAQWQAEASSVFREAYRKHASGIASYPADRAAADALVALFTLEKALYELRYELANRPDWVAIPLAAVVAELALGAS